MHIVLLCTLPASHDRSLGWIRDGLVALGHDVADVHRPDLPADRAADLGYAVADTWDPTPPDAVLALGWVAGVAAQVAAREHAVPVLLRLPRPGRSGDPAVTRVERALARSGATMLAQAPSEAEALARLGTRRQHLRILPEAVDVPVARVTPQAGPDDVVVVTDDDAAGLTALLQGMAAGRPAVVLDRGVLADVVADQVTGLVVSPRDDLRAAVHELRTNPLRRESMGLAAADRAQACFAADVVVPRLGRLVDEACAGAFAAV
jgi:glycosyltransferase involved in cell wall biosynthesis